MFELSVYTTRKPRPQSEILIWLGAALWLLSSSPASAGEPSLADRDDVLLETGFEDANWYSDWGLSSPPQNTRVVQDEPFRGNSLLRVHIAQGSHRGTGFGFKFAERGYSEPEEIYFRYAIRLGPDWRLSESYDGNGKLPGFGGTYNTGGWGGRPSNGTNGWSARMTFKAPSRNADRSTGHTRIGYYVYHADQSGTYGDSFMFDGTSLEPGNVLHRNKWYQVEGYVQMNTPGQNDGLLKGWVDGELVLDKNNLRFRDISRLKIEKIWFNVYVGGSWTAPQDQYVDFDNVVIARNYIGPVSAPAPASPIFSDEPYFGDIRNFEFGDSSRWTVAEVDQDLRLALQRSGSAGEANLLGAYAIGRAREYTDFRLSFEAKSREDLTSNGAADLAAVFGWQDEANYYFWLANARQDYTELFVVQNGQRTSLAVASEPGLVDGDWHNFKVERVGDQITVRRDGVELMRVSDATYPRGRVGVGSLNDTALFDDIAVVDLASQEPSTPEDAGTIDTGSSPALDAGAGVSDAAATGDAEAIADPSEPSEPRQQPSSCSAAAAHGPARGILALAAILLFGVSRRRMCKQFVLRRYAR